MENQENHFIHFAYSSIAIILHVSYIRWSRGIFVILNCYIIIIITRIEYFVVFEENEENLFYSILKVVNDPLARFISDIRLNAIWMDVKGKKILFQFSSFLKIFNNCYIASWYHLCPEIVQQRYNFFHFIFLHLYHILTYIDIRVVNLKKEIENGNF